MRRRRASRKSLKLTPGFLFIALGIGVLASVFGNTNHNSTTTNYAPVTSGTVTSSSTSGPPTIETTPPSPLVSINSQGSDTDFGTLLFVRGRKVALREGPGKQFGIIDRYDIGRQLSLIQQEGDWSKVKDSLTMREGWISASLLTSDRPKEEPKPKAQETEPLEAPPKTPSLPRISDALVVQRIIAGSISMYSGSCACPYSTDRRGRRCGNRSAYSKPGGYAPICFAEDVSAEMIHSFREQR